ncbi:hypothetical protein KP509_12G025700 [Ceratopteris richardii]|nr:hypothetical protein KP509_12G025700 [Ceratopteris richardii]
MVDMGSTVHLVVETALITLYGNCRSLVDAQHVFNNSMCRDIVCWNAFIAASIQNEQYREAISLFYQVQREGILINNVTYVCILDACASLAALKLGKVVHLAILDRHFNQQIITSTALIKMYGRSKSFHDARNVFASLVNPDVVSWTSMVVACTQNEEFQEALNFFYQMQMKNIKGDGMLYACVLYACGESGAIKVGLELHSASICSGHADDPQVRDALVKMYIKCGCVCEAKEVFDMLSACYDSTWNEMIRALIGHSQHREALHLFFHVHHKNMKASELTYVRILNACTEELGIEEGRLVHVCIVEANYVDDIAGATTLISMYGKFKRVLDARNVFDNLSKCDFVAWNAMAAALVQNGRFQEALDLFYQSVHTNMKPNLVSFVSVVEACTGLLSLEDGFRFHTAIIQIFPVLDIILGTALINMYGKCGCLSDAESTMQSLLHQDVIAYTAMISAFIQNDQCKEALQMFALMLKNGVKPDSVTLTCVMEACLHLTLLDFGHIIHMIAIEFCYDEELVIGTSCISMYGNCGSVEDAIKVFEILPHNDIGCWNAMLHVLGHNGNGMASKVLFNQLQHCDIIADHTTFVCAFVAFSHEGMIDDACQLSFLMRYHCLVPTADHYACMLDLFGRAGQLDVSKALASAMPFQGAFAWQCLLGACKINDHFEHGVHAAKFCLEQSTKTDDPFVLSNFDDS